MAISARGIVECDRQQAIIEEWADNLAEMMSSNDQLLFEMGLLAVSIRQLIEAMTDVREQNISSQINYAKHPSYQTTKQKIDQSIVNLGIELNNKKDYGSLVIFYSSVQVAIDLAINGTHQS